MLSFSSHLPNSQVGIWWGHQIMKWGSSASACSNYTLCLYVLYWLVCVWSYVKVLQGMRFCWIYLMWHIAYRHVKLCADVIRVILITSKECQMLAHTTTSYKPFERHFHRSYIYCNTGFSIARGQVCVYIYIEFSREISNRCFENSTFCVYN